MFSVCILFEVVSCSVFITGDAVVSNIRVVSYITLVVGIAFPISCSVRYTSCFDKISMNLPNHNKNR